MSNLERPNNGYTSLLVRMHIRKLADQAMFVTRDCLVYGTRNAVDLVLSRMVKARIIIRLARGVFMKMSSISKLKLPSVLEVAQAKAKAFGKRIFEHGADLAKKLGLVEEANREPSFITDGPTSSFLYGETRIHFKGAAPRKVNLIVKDQGPLINALWYAGRLRTDGTRLMNATRHLGRTERHQLRESMPVMPTWLSAFFCPLSQGIS